MEKIIEKYNLHSHEKLKKFIKENLNKMNYQDILKVIELSNSNRYSNAAYFTDEKIVNEIIKNLPDFKNKECITILEPSVGIGNFLPQLIEKYKTKNVTLILNDIDKEMLSILKLLLKSVDIPKNFSIRFDNFDYLEKKYRNIDLVIGNPPYMGNHTHPYKNKRWNKKSNDLFSYFLEKALSEADNVAFVIPKIFLGSTKYKKTRDVLEEEYSVDTIIDFGEFGFKGVKIETIGIIISNNIVNNKTKIKSFINGYDSFQKKSYIFDKKYPTWLIYRNKKFDDTARKMKFEVFDVYRDRQITNSLISSEIDEVRVLRSQNIKDGEIVSIPGYDRYTTRENIKGKSITKYINCDNLVLVPNMSYNPRACWMPKETIVNGSVAILIPKEKIINKDLKFFATKEFKEFYEVVRNFASRSLNIDKAYVFYFGKLKESEE